MPKIIAIAQGRSGSQRLPRKILMPVEGEPMMARVIERLRRARSLSEVVVATTTDSDDDAVEELSATRGWNCFRGSHHDVLDRYYQAAKKYQADVVVRITCDCPLIEPEVVDRVVNAFVAQMPKVDYVSNVLEPRTYPRGLDTEVFSFAALERSWREGKLPLHREHVTPYIYQNPQLFRMQAVRHERDYSGHRWTVDTVEDMELVRRIYGHFGHDRFGWLEVLELLDQHPDWVAINRAIEQKKLQ